MGDQVSYTSANPYNDPAERIVFYTWGKENKTSVRLESPLRISFHPLTPMAVALSLPQAHLRVPPPHCGLSWSSNPVCIKAQHGLTAGAPRHSVITATLGKQHPALDRTWRRKGFTWRWNSYTLSLALHARSYCQSIQYNWAEKELPPNGSKWRTFKATKGPLDPCCWCFSVLLSGQIMQIRRQRKTYKTIAQCS
jgi:hypothetical protein